MLFFLIVIILNNTGHLSISVLDNLLTIHCPTYLPKPDKTYKPFHYNKQMKRLLRRKKNSWCKMRSDPSNSNKRDDYKASCADFKKELNDYHFKIESDVLNSGESSRFYIFIRNKLKRSSKIHTINNGNHPVSDPEDKADLFNNFFSSNFTVDNGLLPNFPMRVDAYTSLDTISFTTASVKNKLLKLKKSYTTNPDTFPSVILRSCAHQLAYPLFNIFTTAFETSTLPLSLALFHSYSSP